VALLTALAGACPPARPNGLISMPDILLISVSEDANALSYRSVFQTFGFRLREAGPDDPLQFDSCGLVAVPLQSAELLAPAKVE